MAWPDEAMNERLEVFSSRLPQDLLAAIAKYDSHPTADLIRSLKIRDIPEACFHPSFKHVVASHPTHFCPIVRERKRREVQNQNRHRTGNPFLPIFGDPHSWLLTFDPWRFQTLPELDYLPDWVREEFRA